MWYDIAFWTNWAASPPRSRLPILALPIIHPLRGKVRTKATTHMMFHLPGVACLFAAGLLMIGGSASTGFFRTQVFAIQAGTLAAVTISGWLGAELVHRHRLGVMGASEPVREEVPIADR